MADETMALGPKMARGIHCCPKTCLFLLPHHRLYTVHNMCTRARARTHTHTHTHTHSSKQDLFAKYLTNIMHYIT